MASKTVFQVDTHPSARETWRERMRGLFERVFRPAPVLTLSQWADLHAVVPSTSAEPGRWRTSRTPYLREIMDSISDPMVREIVVMKPAQVGATVGLIGNAVCYWIDVDPAPIIIVQPTQGDAEKYSKEKLQPILDDCAKIRDKVAPQKSRGGENTIRNKQFLLGWIGLIGAESPRELRSRSAPRILFDERDAYKRSSGEEGDPAALGEKRTNTFPLPKLVTTSTPLIKGDSPTEALYLRSDQRRYFCACPHCGEEQVLEWGGPDAAFGIKWERVVGEDGRSVHRPETAHYVCKHCQCVIEEHHKPKMVMEGRWVAQRPGASIRGYHFSALISLFPGASWGKIVEEFLAAQEDQEKLQVWVNTVLAETWEVPTAKLEVEGLEARAEIWQTATGERIEVPAGVGILTAFADVQKNRIEILIMGWGAGEESWMIAHHRIYGDVTADPTLWARVDAVRTRAYQHECGAKLRIAAFGIDTGDGTRVNELYDYIRPRQREGVWATKGQPERQKEPIRVPKGPDKSGIRRVDIGTFPMKSSVSTRLRLELGAGGRVPPGYMHFRKVDPDWHNGADAEFYAQFGREKPIRVRKPNGQWVTEWKKTGANEALDLEVGNLAMLHVLGPSVRESLGTFADQLRAYAGKQITLGPVRKRRVRKRGVRV